MTSTQRQARYDRAARAHQMGLYRIDEDPSPLYDFTVSYTDRAGRPVVYHVNAFGCTCPDFLRNGEHCKHQDLCQLHREEIARFEQMIDATLAEIEAKHSAPAHTVYHPIPGFWGLRLQSQLEASEIIDRIGPALAAKCEIEANRQRGYFQAIDPGFPVRLQARVMDLTAEERAAILSALEVA